MQTMTQEMNDFSNAVSKAFSAYDTLDSLNNARFRESWLLLKRTVAPLSAQEAQELADAIAIRIKAEGC